MGPWLCHGCLHSEDVQNNIAHDFSALDDLVRLGDGLERKAVGDGVSEPPAFKQFRQFLNASRAIRVREVIDQKSSQSNAVHHQPVTRQSGLRRRRAVHDDRGVRPQDRRIEFGIGAQIHLDQRIYSSSAGERLHPLAEIFRAVIDGFVRPSRARACVALRSLLIVVITRARRSFASCMA